MPTLENDSLVFRFPEIEKKALFSIDFQRTLRIPDSNSTYSLPPGLGRFSIRHAEDYSDKLPQAVKLRGGAILPIWQSEAMWLNFNNEGPHWDLDFPVAVKIAAGKINAISGEHWRSGLHRDPQDYVVSPEQPWLDGFAIEKGVIRQFVAMPLGEGYSVEEQITGKSEWGGIQIQVIPLKKNVWKRKLDQWKRRNRNVIESEELRTCYSMAETTSMGLGAGGRMHQEIYPDPYNLDDWDFSAADRVFVTLVHAKDWKLITGENAQNFPPTAKEYSNAGLPWFEYYGNDQGILPGSHQLSNVKSVGTIFQNQTGANLPNSEDFDVNPSNIMTIKGSMPRRVKTGNIWDE